MSKCVYYRCATTDAYWGLRLGPCAKGGGGDEISGGASSVGVLRVTKEAKCESTVDSRYRFFFTLSHGSFGENV